MGVGGRKDVSPPGTEQSYSPVNGSNQCMLKVFTNVKII